MNCPLCGAEITGDSTICPACGKQAAQELASATALTGVGVGLRTVATVLDWIVMFFLFYAIAVVSGQTTSSGFSLTGVPFFISMLVGFAYYVVFEGIIGATPGKLALGLTIVKADGGKCDMQAALIRTVLRIVDGFFFYIVAAIVIWTSPLHQRLGDRIANTVVVKRSQAKIARASAA